MAYTSQPQPLPQSGQPNPDESTATPPAHHYAEPPHLTPVSRAPRPTPTPVPPPPSPSPSSTAPAVPMSPSAPATTAPSSGNLFDQPLPDAAQEAQVRRIQQMPPAMTVKQDVLAQQEHEEMFVQEKLTLTQKALIIIIAFVSVGAVIGGGLWLYLKVNDATPADTTKQNTNQTKTNTKGNSGGVADADKDGLSDAEEATLGTNPQKFDTDGDGYNDGEEVRTKHNPLAK